MREHRHPRVRRCVKINWKFANTKGNLLPFVDATPRQILSDKITGVEGSLGLGMDSRHPKHELSRLDCG